MSDNISKINRDKYNQKGALDYLSNKWHKVRAEKSLGLIRDYKKQHSTNLKALDIGCGDGEMGLEIIKLGIETHGIDVAEGPLTKAREKGLHTVNGDIQKTLPFENNYFDIVFAGEIIEHIADPRYFVTEVNRILKVGGIFIVTTPNLAGFDNRLRLLFGNIPRCIEPLSSHHYQHIRPFTFSSLKEFLNRGGFEIASFKSNRIKFGFSIQSYSLADFFPSFGHSLILGAIKVKNVGNISLNEY